MGDRNTQRTGDWRRGFGVHLYLAALADANGDGVGDLGGVYEALRYWEALGSRQLALPPAIAPDPTAGAGIDAIMTGPLTRFDPAGKDGPYGVTDFREVAPEFGSDGLLRALVRDAAKLGIGLVIDGVFNHTSDQHPWFRRALADPTSPFRGYYTFGTEEEMRRDFGSKRPLFPDAHQVPWSTHPDDVEGLRYLHTFFGGVGGQPDLNIANPAVTEELTRILRFMVEDVGAAGVRLDAVTFYDAEPGTNGESRPRALELVRRWRDLLDRDFSGAYLLAETNQPLDKQAEWLQAAHTAYNFHLMNAIWTAYINRSWTPVLDALTDLAEHDPEGRMSTFLRNHDELTLEMATPEVRDLLTATYGGERGRYRVNYGLRQRTFDLVGGNENAVVMLHTLLAVLPGKPWLYAGDEIGMLGSRDLEIRDSRDAARTPFQWNARRNAGFSNGPGSRLYLPVGAGAKTHNVEAQFGVAGSLLERIATVIALRRTFPALYRAWPELLPTGRPSVACFVHDDAATQPVVTLVSLEPTPVEVELDLGARFGSRRWWNVLDGGQQPWFGIDTKQRISLAAYGTAHLLPY